MSLGTGLLGRTLTGRMGTRIGDGGTGSDRGGGIGNNSSGRIGNNGGRICIDKV